MSLGSPGEIDGKGGPNTKRAIAAFEREKRTTVADAVVAMGVDATVGPFIEAIPEDMAEKAKLKRIDPYKVLR